MISKDLSWEHCEKTFKAEIESMHNYFEKKKINIEDFNRLDPVEKVGCLFLWEKQELSQFDAKIQELLK